MYYPFYLDWTMLLIIPGLIISIWAQSKISRAYNTYSKIPVMSGISGAEVARRMLYARGMEDVQIIATHGKLTDNYNPRKRIVNLSQSNYSGSSIAAVAVAAHETGHAIQHNENYFPLTLRSVMAPVVSVASYLLWPILILGFLAEIAGIINIAVYIFIGIFMFQLVTLPVEFNASRRALAELKGQGVLAEEELYGAQKMLRAAALTYVAATLVALLNVVRFMALARRR